MNYNISFQIAGLIVVAILMIVFFTKKKWPSKANAVYRVILIITFVELMLDIASVIAITKFLAGDKSIALLNDFLAKLYLIVMITFILSVEIYAIINTVYENISKTRLTMKYVEFAIATIVYGVCTFIILINPVKYGGEGSYVYSYGLPSDTVYMCSTFGVIYCIIIFIFNIKKVSFKRLVPIAAFCVMEGAIAIFQAFNKELLLVGFGLCLVDLVMYFALENPDINMIDELNKANARSRRLLLNILPLPIARKLEYKLEPFFDYHRDVSIMFFDIIDFTKLSSEVGAVQIVKLLNSFFTKIDSILPYYKVEKIKTIGDAYMVAAGIPNKNDKNCEEIVKFAKHVLKLLDEFNEQNDSHLQIRIGIHNGDVVAGVIGKDKFIYDLWGDAVNYASRLENVGKPNLINVSEKVKYVLGDKYEYFSYDSKNVKGYGDITSYILK